LLLFYFVLIYIFFVVDNIDIRDVV